MGIEATSACKYLENSWEQSELVFLALGQSGERPWSPAALQSSSTCMCMWPAVQPSSSELLARCQCLFGVGHSDSSADGFSWFQF